MRIASVLMVFVFWLSLGVVIYTYLVYPLVLLVFFAISQLRTDFRYLFNRIDRRVGRFGKTELPSVTFVIPAHNEETHLPEKLRNISVFDYPLDKLQVVIVSDGSTDGTNDILRKIGDPHIETLILPKRRGKAGALNSGVAAARHEVLVFSDASTLFEPDTLRNLVRHFRDQQTGAVCGALRFHASSDSRQTEGVYWKYESALRLMESRLGATLNASGAVYALRREAYSPLPIGAVLDDLLVPMNARTLGYRVLYDPEAVATDFAPDTIRGEFARRVRIAAGSFQALPSLMRVPFDGFAAFSFISHKLLRWFVPFFLVALLISNALLVGRPWYTAFALLQSAFYLWAFLGFACHKYFRRVRYALIGYFLFAMNAAFVVGFFRYIQNRQAIEWQR
jgi:cellulose synthase/poly-beta-1,6-N-acetylglucosamine synthase-like glycosyltransferase